MWLIEVVVQLRVAKDLYEKETKNSAVSNQNALNYKYFDDTKNINEHGGRQNEQNNRKSRLKNLLFCLLKDKNDVILWYNV